MLLDQIIVPGKIDVLRLLSEGGPLKSRFQADPAVADDELIRQISLIIFGKFPGNQRIPGQVRLLLKEPVLCFAPLIGRFQDRRYGKAENQEQKNCCDID